MTSTAHYNSPLGGITMASDGQALIGLWFDDQKHFGSTMVAQEATPAGLPVFDEARLWLDIYFSGCEPDFMPSVLFIGTRFQQRVWKALRTIPYGQTISYGELASHLGVRSAQAVGGAVGRNPVSIIVPCHRVVGTDGSLTGYAAGLDRKRALLQIEQKNYFAI
ncbi:MAG: methylated-DNA--[protein]-cysteine S-methyltransferase [Bacteroidales bacterium]|nr:methylated-DNA--[protein]-cysteine S-methyltransferase [Bacteroidales bacterium]